MKFESAMRKRIEFRLPFDNVTEIRLRSMMTTDLPSVLKLEKHCYPTPWPPCFFRRQLRSEGSCWIYELNTEIIGYGVVRFRRNWAHVMNLCIAESFRRQGLGRRMMLHLLAVSRDRGATRAWLEVRPDNRIAIALYERLGFRKKQRIRGYYRHSPRGQRDALFMTCRL